MIKGWIYTVVGSAALCAVCSAVIPEGKTRKAFEFICGLVMITAILSPIKSFDFDEYSLSAAKYRQEAELLIESAGEQKEMLDRRYIEQEYAAYILDKAQMNGVVLNEVRVTVAWSNEGYWYPVSVEIILNPEEYAKDRTIIQKAIETDLGIGIDNQNWRTP